MSRRLGQHNIPNRKQPDALLAWASFQLRSAQLGWDMYEAARPIGDDNDTGHPFDVVEIAAQNLVYSSVVTAMDQCAAAVFRLTRPMSTAVNEPDVDWWFKKPRAQLWKAVDPALEQWLRGFHGNSTWELASGLRDAFTHRAVRRHVKAVIVEMLPALRGGSDHSGSPVNKPVTTHRGRTSVPLLIDDMEYDPIVVMPEVLAYGEQRYREFDQSLALAYP